MIQLLINQIAPYRNRLQNCLEEIAKQQGTNISNINVYIDWPNVIADFNVGNQHVEYKTKFIHKTKQFVNEGFQIDGQKWKTADQHDAHEVKISDFNVIQQQVSNLVAKIQGAQVDNRCSMSLESADVCTLFYLSNP